MSRADEVPKLALPVSARATSTARFPTIGVSFERVPELVPAWATRRVPRPKLPLALPALRAFDTIESRWPQLSPAVPAPADVAPCNAPAVRQVQAARPGACRAR